MTSDQERHLKILHGMHSQLRLMQEIARDHGHDSIDDAMEEAIFRVLTVMNLKSREAGIPKLSDLFGLFKDKPMKRESW